MKPWIAFLRGVTPSGKNAVKMADVREVLSAHGFALVRTWIQSGNIALSSALDAAQTAATIQQLWRDQLQVDLSVVVKSAEELRAILDGNPFAAPEHELQRVFFTLCAQPLRAKPELVLRDFGDEKLHIAPHAAYMYIPGNAARSQLSNTFLEKQLGVRLTTRNANTLRKMVSF